MVIVFPVLPQGSVYLVLGQFIDIQSSLCYHKDLYISCSRPLNGHTVFSVLPQGSVYLIAGPFMDIQPSLCVTYHKDL